MKITRAQQAQWLEDVMLLNYYRGGKSYARYKGDITKFTGLGCCKRYLNSKTIAKDRDKWGIVELLALDPRFKSLFTTTEQAEATRRARLAGGKEALR